MFERERKTAMPTTRDIEQPLLHPFALHPSLFTLHPSPFPLHSSPYPLTLRTCIHPAPAVSGKFPPSACAASSGARRTRLRAGGSDPRASSSTSRSLSARSQTARSEIARFTASAGRKVSKFSRELYLSLKNPACIPSKRYPLSTGAMASGMEAIRFPSMNLSVLPVEKDRTHQ